jgi:hypothetical protein
MSCDVDTQVFGFKNVISAETKRSILRREEKNDDGFHNKHKRSACHSRESSQPRLPSQPFRSFCRARLQYLTAQVLSPRDSPHFLELLDQNFAGNQLPHRGNRQATPGTGLQTTRFGEEQLERSEPTDYSTLMTPAMCKSFSCPALA